MAITMLSERPAGAEEEDEEAEVAEDEREVRALREGKEAEREDDDEREARVDTRCVGNRGGGKREKVVMHSREERSQT